VVVQVDTAVPEVLAQYILLNSVHIPMVIKVMAVVVAVEEIALAMRPVVAVEELDYLVKEPMAQVAQVLTMEMVIKQLPVVVGAVVVVPGHLVLVTDMLEMLVLAVHMAVVEVDTVLTTAEHLRPAPVVQYVLYGQVRLDHSQVPA
jgi:hypothetical protein